MSNVTYFKFRNTKQVFEDCLETIKTSSISKLDNEEKQSYESLKELVEEFFDYTEDFEETAECSSNFEFFYDELLDAISERDVVITTDGKNDLKYVYVTQCVYNTEDKKLKNSATPLITDNYDAMASEIIEFLTKHNLKAIAMLKT